MTALCPIGDFIYQGSANAVLPRYVFRPFSGREFYQYIRNIRVLQFGGGMAFTNFATAPILILKSGIFAPRNPTKVSKVVIGPNAVDMIDSGIFKMSVNKRKANQPMDVHSFDNAAAPNLNPLVAIANFWRKNFTFPHLAWLMLSSTCRQIILNANAAMIGYIEPSLKALGFFPVFHVLSYGGQVGECKGLTRRREAEKAMYLS